MVEMQEKQEAVLVGVDVGSTTTKIAAFDAGEGVLIPAEIFTPCRGRLPDLRDLTAVWLFAESCGGQRYLKKIKRTLPGRADPAIGLRSGCKFCKCGESSADADYEPERRNAFRPKFASS